MTEVQAHVYGPVLGDPELRQEIARQWSAAYAGEIRYSQVAVTSGCNQAFVAVVSTLAGSGDSVIITAPWYFNHKMWLDMMGIEAKVPDNGGSLRARPGCHISIDIGYDPGNCAGFSQQPDGRRVFSRYRQAGLRTGKAQGNRADLWTKPTVTSIRDQDHCTTSSTDPGWPGSFIHLYSFSKAYRLTGHRVGAIVASEAVLAEIEKFLDSVAICPNRIGQHAALYGMRHLGGWLAGEQKGDSSQTQCNGIRICRPRRVATAWLRGIFCICRVPVRGALGQVRSEACCLSVEYLSCLDRCSHRMGASVLTGSSGLHTQMSASQASENSSRAWMATGPDGSRLAPAIALVTCNPQILSLENPFDSEIRARSKWQRQTASRARTSSSIFSFACWWSGWQDSVSAASRHR